MQKSYFLTLSMQVAGRSCSAVLPVVGDRRKKYFPVPDLMPTSTVNLDQSWYHATRVHVPVSILTPCYSLIWRYFTTPKHRRPILMFQYCQHCRFSKEIFAFSVWGWMCIMYQNADRRTLIFYILFSWKIRFVHGGKENESKELAYHVKYRESRFSFM